MTCIINTKIIICSSYSSWHIKLCVRDKDLRWKRGDSEGPIPIKDGNKPATRRYPPRPVYVIGYRVGFFFFTETGFNLVFNGSGFIEKPESDPKYLKKKPFLLQSSPNLSVSLFFNLTRPAPSSLSLSLSDHTLPSRLLRSFTSSDDFSVH